MKGRSARWLAPGSFGRNVSMLAGSTAMGQVVVLASSPLLTRLYEPKELGTLAVYVAVLSTLSTIGALRYELAIPLPGDDDEAANVLAVSLVAALTLASIVGIATVFFGDDLAGLLGTAQLATLLWLLPISLLGASIYISLSYWAIRVEEFRLIARTRIYQSSAMVTTQLALGLVGVGAAGLLVGDAIGRAGGSGTLARRLVARDKASIKRISLSSMKLQANRYRRFPLLSSGSGLINSLGLNLPPLIIAGLYGPAVAGWFGLAQRVVIAPVGVIGLSVSKVYFSRAAQLSREDIKDLERLFRRTARQLFFVGLPVAVILAAAAPPLFTTIFGEAWRSAGDYARIMSVMFLAQFVAVPLSQTLNVLEKQGLQFSWDLFRLVAVVAAFGFGAWFDWTIGGTVALWTAAMTASYGILLVLTLRTMRATISKGPEAS